MSDIAIGDWRLAIGDWRRNAGLAISRNDHPMTNLQITHPITQSPITQSQLLTVSAYARLIVRTLFENDVLKRRNDAIAGPFTTEPLVLYCEP